MASHIRTPGSVGRPGKCPAKNHSSPVRCQRPVAPTPGSMATISSTNRNGGRCGRIEAGSGRSLISALQCGEELERGVLRADLVPDLLQVAVRPDEEGGAL